MSTAPSPQDSTSRRSVFGLSRDTYLSANTIRRAERQGYDVYWAADGESEVFDCTVATYGYDGSGLISVWDAE